MAKKIQELIGKRQALANETLEVLAKYKDEAGEYKAMPAEVIEANTKRNEQMADIVKQMSELTTAYKTEELANKALEESAKMAEQYKTDGNRPNFGGAFGKDGDNEPKFRSAGEAFIQSDGFKAYQQAKNINNVLSQELPFYGFGERGFGYKTDFTEGSSYAPANFRLPKVVFSAQRTPSIIDLMPAIQTSERSAIPYMLETTLTNAAAEKAEGVALAESALAYTAQTQPIELIGTFIPVSEQVLEDVARIQALIDNRLTLMHDQRLETQIIAGNGSTPNLLGYLSKSNLQTQAKGADDIYTAIAKGIDKVEFTGFAPNDAVILNNAQWLAIRTTKDTTGQFIWGPPNLAGDENIWGYPIFKNTAMTAGTALVGAFRTYSERYIARNVIVEIGRINDQFVKNMFAIRITSRQALVIGRGDAFCQVTGL